MDDGFVFDCFFAERGSLAELARLEQTCIAQQIKAYEQGISCAGGKTLKWRIGVSGRIQRKNLPEFLPCSLQEVEELVCLRTEVSHSVGSRQ